MKWLVLVAVVGLALLAGPSGRPGPQPAAAGPATAPPPPTFVFPPASWRYPTFDISARWENPPGTTQVHLQLVPFGNDGPGADLYFGSPVTEFAAPAPPKWYGVLPEMTYRWRVRASTLPVYAGPNDPSWSAWTERSFGAPIVSSSTIRPVSPVDVAVDTLTPVLRWANTDLGVWYYEVQLSKDPAFKNAFVYWNLIHGGVTAPPNSYAVPPAYPLEPGTAYYWRVRPRVQGDALALDSSGGESRRLGVAWSVPYTFRTRCIDPATGATSDPPCGLPEVVAAFDGLSAYLNGLPESQLPSVEREGLLPAVQKARAAYIRGQSCDAASQLDAYLSAAQALRQGQRVALAEDLFNRGQMVRHDVLAPFGAPSLQQGRPCPGYDPATRVALGQSDNRLLQVTVNFADPTFVTVRTKGEVFTQITIDAGDALAGEPGKPGVPIWYSLVGVPRGTRASITARVLGSQEYFLNLFPYQHSPVDPRPRTEGDFRDLPFVKDERAYATDAPYPREICAVVPVGDLRDLPVVQVQCAAGQYNPVTDRLISYTGLEFTVTFAGGTGYFVTQAAQNPFEDTNSLTGAVLNGGTILRYVDPSTIGGVCLGSELLILTHPNFRSAADTLKDWKRKKGISTNVVEVGSGTAYDTSDKIDDLIEKRYADCQVRLSYALLLGDSEYIPTYAVTTESAKTDNYPSGRTGSDFYYALTGSGSLDILPDIGLARIPVDSLSQAETVVNKIIQYESNPPILSSFYANASFASQFQCCRMEDDGTPLDGNAGTDQRAFIETSEFARDHLRSQGYTVERIYTETVDSDYSGSSTPRRYYDGTLLPSALGSGSGFAWSGSTTDITNAFNAGRFLILHRDHGSQSGWSNPGFSTTSANSLTNGSLLPVVFSVNCTSGLFDNEQHAGDYGVSSSSTYFAEALLRHSNGGAVGVLGDTRISPTWANNALTRGFFDAIWPSLISGYGGSTRVRRLGDILNHGKAYMLTQMGVSWSGTPEVSATSAVDELFLWHAFGDPTQEIWTSRPVLLTGIAVATTGLGSITVRYSEEGATITALQEDKDGNSRPIARAVVRSGQAELRYVVEPDPGRPVLLSACKQEAVCVLLGQSAGATPTPTPRPALTPTQSPIIPPTPTPTAFRPVPTPTPTPRPPGVTQ